MIYGPRGLVQGSGCPEMHTPACGEEKVEGPGEGEPGVRTRTGGDGPATVATSPGRLLVWRGAGVCVGGPSATFDLATPRPGGRGRGREGLWEAKMRQGNWRMDLKEGRRGGSVPAALRTRPGERKQRRECVKTLTERSRKRGMENERVQSGESDTASESDVQGGLPLSPVFLPPSLSLSLSSGG